MGLLNRIPWRYYGVWLLPLGGAMAFVCYGSVLYTWPVFFPVIVKEFGWSAAVTATASSLARFEGGFEGPVVGWVLDKYGPRVIMFIGGIMIGLGFIALRFMNDVVWYYVFFGIIVNLGYNSSGYAASWKAAADWWVKWRARAISIMILPVAISGIFGPSIGTWAIQNYGWRDAVTVMGVLVLIVYIPTSLLVRPHRPEYYGLLPDGDDPNKVKAASQDQKNAEEALAKATMQKEVDWTIREALKSFTFWIYSLASTLYAFGFAVILLFVPMHLMSRGFDAMTAAMYAGLMMTFTYIGRFIVLAIGDVFSPKWLMVAAYALQGLGAVSMASASSDATYLALGYDVLFGVGYGMWIPLSPSVRGWLFGRGNFGTIGGIVALIGMAGTIVAAPFAGYMYDLYQNYYIAYMVFGVAMLLAAFFFIFVRRKSARAATTGVPNPIKAS